MCVSFSFLQKYKQLISSIWQRMEYHISKIFSNYRNNFLHEFIYQSCSFINKRVEWSRVENSIAVNARGFTMGIADKTGFTV